LDLFEDLGDGELVSSEDVGVTVSLDAEEGFAEIGLDESWMKGATLAERIERVYLAVIEEGKIRRARNEALNRFSARHGGMLGGLFEEFTGGGDIDEGKLASDVFDKIISEGRDILHLNTECSMDTYALRQKFLEPVRERHQERTYGMERRRRLADDEHEEKPEKKLEPLRLDVRGLIAELESTYGGDAGRQVEVQQAARTLMEEMNLKRQSFEVRSGKVTVEVRVWSENYSWSKNEYSHTSRDSLAKIGRALLVMLDDSGERVPAMLLSGGRGTGLSVAGPESGTWKLGPDMSIRFFKNVAKFSFSERMAEVLRAFVSEQG
jgi:hypothetical protein